MDLKGDEKPKRIRWPKSALVAMFGLVYGLWFLWHHLSTGAELQTFERSLRQKGYPVAFVDLNDWYASVPSNQNAAVVYWDAFANLVPTDSPRFAALATNIWKVSLSLSADFPELSPWEELVASNRNVLDRLCRAMQLTESRYPLDFRYGAAVPLVHLGKITLCSQLLFVEALLRAARNDSEAAVQSILANLALGDSLASEPVAQSHGCRSYCNRTALASLTLILNRTHLNDLQLRSLTNAFYDTELTSDVTGAFLGELCFGLRAEPRELIVGGEHSSLLASLSGEILNAVLVLADREDADKFFYGNTLWSYLNACRNPYPLRLQMAPNARTVCNQAKRRGYLISACLLPRLDGILAADAENIAGLRVIQTVLAIERYRLGHELNPPAKLRDLCPDFVAAVPQDPFDGRPLRYRLLADRYVVYSVGKDLQDNQGENRKEWQGPNSPFDIGVTVKRRL